MNTILLDTNAYVAFKQGQADAVEIIQRAQRLALSSIVLGELLAGFAVGSREATNRLELQLFLASERVQIVRVDEETAVHYAMVYRALRSKGQPIPTNDMWIAASALQHGYALYSYDRHFRAVDGLRVGATPFGLLDEGE
ncbi:MAG: type II toxin-antitoxin system VapC family toxin [Anaerolineae bacterium]